MTSISTKACVITLRETASTIIGHLMIGSGQQELPYARNTASHMLTGKAVSRAVRDHLLIDAVLYTILIADAYSVP